LEGAEAQWSRARFTMSPGVGLVVLEFFIRQEGKWVPDTRDEMTAYRLSLPAEPQSP
jgi:hypothetical protein